MPDDAALQQAGETTEEDAPLELDKDSLPHEFAARAVANAAEVEKFFDDVLINDFKTTPLNNLDEVLDERREREERKDRLASRAKELLEEEMAKAKHEKEVKDLEEAISITAVPAEVGGSGKGGSGSKAKGGGGSGGGSGGGGGGTGGGTGSASSSGADGRGSPADDEAAAPAQAPFKLSSEGRKKSEANPYVLNLTEFVPELDATRKARELKAENEALRACLKNGANPKAFEQYLRRSSHTSI